MNQALTTRFQEALQEVNAWGADRNLTSLLEILQEMQHEDSIGTLYSFEQRAFKIVMFEMSKLFKPGYIQWNQNG